MAIWLLILALYGIGTSQTTPPVCVPPTADPPSLSFTIDDTDDPALFGELLLDFLNAGGSFSAIEASFSTFGGAFGEGDGGVRWVDVLGDETPEALVWVTRYMRTAPQSGYVLVFACQDHTYTVYPTAVYVSERGPFGATGIAALWDVTGDGKAEIIVSTASTRPDYIWLISRLYIAWHWDGQAFVMITPFQSPEGYPSFGMGLLSNNGMLMIEDTDGNGIAELLIQTSEGRHGDPLLWSRLNRPRVARYEWNGEAILYQCFYYATPAIYRIQALLDANAALGCGDVEGALANLDQIIADDTLLAWTPLDNRCPGCDPNRHQEKWAAARQTLEAEGLPLIDPSRDVALQAYAHFRRLLIYVWQGDAEAVAAEYATFTTDYPEHAYTQLAAYFLEVYADDYTLACEMLGIFASREDIRTPLTDYLLIGPHPRPTDQLCPTMPEHWTNRATERAFITLSQWL